ncbi:MAG: cysteine desulfurase [Burkholderiales bacterium]
MTAATLTKQQAATGYDLVRVREDFPILKELIHGKPLVYLDNAATSQKPWSVINAERDYYTHLNANIHRGVHDLSQRATDAFEGARNKARQFINARKNEEVIFVRGATEAINLVATSYGRSKLKAGDEIIVSEMEHHSNIVPWQMACEATGAVLRVIPISDSGELDMDAYAKLLNERTKIVAITHVANALGSITPLKKITAMAHAAGAIVLVDGAQAAPHVKIDVQDLDADFYALSGHKIYGPTGIGILYGKEALLEAMPPYQGGGDMIRTVSFKKTTYNTLPYKFEAGTPFIAGGIGLGAAIDYLNELGLDAIAVHEHDLLLYTTEQAKSIPGLKIIGTARDKASVFSFTLAGVHPHDIGTILDHEGIAIRTGHHCAMPVMERLGIPATARASFGLYNTHGEVDALFDGIRKVQKVFA